MRGDRERLAHRAAILFAGGSGLRRLMFPRISWLFEVSLGRAAFNSGFWMVARVNAEQRHRFLRKVKKALWTLKGKKLAVLGLAFKNGIDDIREFPAVAIVKALLKGRLRGCLQPMIRPP